MAFGKTATAGLMLAIQLGAAQFPMRHEHLRKGCDGTMTVDETGIRFVGPKGHVWNWRYEDIQQLTLLPGGVNILTYKDSRLRLGADVEYRFTGKLPAKDLYPRVVREAGSTLRRRRRFRPGRRPQSRPSTSEPSRGARAR